MSASAVATARKVEPKRQLSDAEWKALDKIAMALSRRYSRRIVGFDSDELYSVALMAIAEGVRKHDESKGQLKHYCKTLIQGRISDYKRSYHLGGRSSWCRGLGRMTRIDDGFKNSSPNSWESTRDDQTEAYIFRGENPESAYSAAMNLKRLMAAITIPLNRFVVERRLEGCPLKDIGKMLGVNESRASQRYAEAVRQMRAAA